MCTPVLLTVMATSSRACARPSSGNSRFPPPENDRLDHEPVLAEAAAEEAHRQGLPITAHAHGRHGIVQAGFDGVEHASFLTPGARNPTCG
jgi:imidazolonepropionase-like amidohydrolase